MKKLLLLFTFCFVCLQLSAQSEKLHFVTINQKKCIKKRGYDLKLKTVIADSRCPEDVTCVWAGEAQVVISVYQNRKLIEDNTLVLSSKTQKENVAWFAKYLPEKQKNIKSITLLPKPKSGIPINPKKYTAWLGYSD